MRKRIQADHVGRAVRGALRPADQRAGQRVDFVEPQPEFLRVVKSRQDRKHADPVGDEIGRVLGTDDALAQRGHQEFLELVEDCRIGGTAGNQLHQMHVARRVEKMHAAETAAHLRRHRLGQRVDRESGCVAGKDGVLAQMRRDFFVQRLLPVHALGNRLDDDVALLEQLQVLVVVRGLDAVRPGCHGQRAGFELLQAVDGLAHVVVRIAFLRRQFEEDRLDAGVDQMGRDLRAHDAGTQHGDFADDESGWDCHVGSLSIAAAGSSPCRKIRCGGGLAPAAGCCIRS